MWRPLLSAALLVASACDCDEPAGDRDAAPSRDAAPDRDIPPPRDASVDVDPDGPLDPNDPGWEPQPGLSTDCHVERARQPDALYPDGHWDPCPERQACEHFAPAARYQFSFNPWGGHDGLGSFSQVTREEDRRTVILRTSDAAPPLAAWRERPLTDGVCQVELGYFREEVVVGIEMVSELRLFRSPVGEARDVSEPMAVLGPEVLRGSTAQQIVVSEDLVALEMEPASFVLVVEDGQAVALPNLPESLRGIVDGIQATGSHVLWQEWGDHVRIAHRAPSGKTELFRAIDDGDVKAFTTDGVDMAWVEAHNRDPDGSYESIGLWTSPYSRTPAELQPRKVADLPGNVAEAFLGGGWWGFMRSFDEVQINHWELVLYRLADGQVRRFDFPEGYAVHAEIAWLTGTELATSARGIFNENRFFRVHIDQLPPD